MALLTLNKGSSSNLSNVAIKDGQLLVTTDTKKIYLDNGTTRLPLSNASYAHYNTNNDNTVMSGKYYKINIISETSWMLAFTIRLYNSYKFYDIDISGYNYGTNHWYNPTAKLANSTENSIEVTFGYDADWKLWICIPAAAYTGLDIFNVTNGFTQIDLFNAFSISLVDAIPETIQSTQLIYRPWRQSDNVTAYNALMLTNARTFSIADNDGTNIGPTVSFNGTANVIINLPSTIKASITGNASGNLPHFFITDVTAISAAPLASTSGWYHMTIGDATVLPTSNHGSVLIENDCGTPYQIFFPDNSLYIYKRYSSSGAWGSWSKIQAGNADTATSATTATQDGSGNVITSTYLKLSGGTMTGALNFTNSTLNLMGDDAYIGDQNQAGCICIKGANGTTGLCFIQNDASAMGFIKWNGSNFYPSNTLNFSNMTGEWTSAPNWRNAFINFGSRTHTQVTGTYYMPWLSGVDYVESHGYGATVTLGIYHNNAPSNGGLYIGMSWDGQANDTFYTFRRDGVFTATSVYGAVWNDYAEFRTPKDKQIFKPGTCVIEVGDDTLIASTERMQAGALIVSDTFGFAIGETEECTMPIATSGRVLAIPFEPRESYLPGDPVCSGPNGTVSKMSEQEIMMYPHKMIGTVSAIPSYTHWGSGNVEVNGRIWIQIR